MNPYVGKLAVLVAIILIVASYLVGGRPKSAVQANPQCQQYLDRAIALAERAERTFGGFGEIGLAPTSQAWTAIYRVCSGK